MHESSNEIFFNKMSKKIDKLNQIDSNPLISGLNIQLSRLKEQIASKAPPDSIKPMLEAFENSLMQLHTQESIDQSQDPIKNQLVELKKQAIAGMRREISDYFVVVGNEIYINTKNTVIRSMEDRITKNAGEPGILGSFIKSLSS